MRTFHRETRVGNFSRDATKQIYLLSNSITCTYLQLFITSLTLIYYISIRLNSDRT